MGSPTGQGVVDDWPRWGAVKRPREIGEGRGVEGSPKGGGKVVVPRTLTVNDGVSPVMLKKKMKLKK